LERQAIPCYLAALGRDLPPAQRREAWLGLGSTYRALGKYPASLRAFDDGLAEFPQANELRLFRAMTLYNLDEGKRAVADLLLLLAETSSDPDIRGYQRAIRHYAADLNHID
jgi:tetratricopeptide (TPR) repeat protein